MGQIWSGSGTPSIEEIVKSCYKQAEWYFMQDYGGLHVVGLLHLEWFLCAIEAITRTPLRPVKLSQEVTFTGLKTVDNLLTKWQPFGNVKTGEMKSHVRANIPQSCQTLLQSISETARRLSDAGHQTAQGDSLGQSSDFLVKIAEKAENARRVIIEQFSPYYNCNCCVWTNGNYLVIKANENGNGWLSKDIGNLSSVVTERGFPALKMATIELTPMAEKLKGLVWTDLIAVSTDPICQICHDNLENAKSLSFLVHCNHVCCSKCIFTWFEELTTTQRNWSCPTCEQEFVEIGTIDSRGKKYLGRLCPTSQLYFQCSLQVPEVEDE